MSPSPTCLWRRTATVRSRDSYLMSASLPPRHVSAAFPDGYTVLDAAGYWRSGPDTTAKERAKIILIIAPADAREKVLSVARQYQKEFAQEAVLISSSEAETDIVSAKGPDGK